MSATCGGSRLAAQHIHPSPSIDLSYTSLREDAKVVNVAIPVYQHVRNVFA